MKQSHKFRSLGDVQAVIDRSPDLATACRQLGINRSTLTRWLQSGKVTRANGAPAPPSQAPSQPEVALPADADDWATKVRTTYTLTATDETLLAMAIAAAALAGPDEPDPKVRLSAMGRYQALVKQLMLTDEKRKDAAPKPDSRQARPQLPRSAGSDPRAVLMAVK